MPVLVSMLRGINVGGRNLIPMEGLRALYASLNLEDARTYVQSGNVVFRTAEKNRARLGETIEKAIEKKWGFRPAVVLRSASELRTVVANNPFAKREDVHPGKLLVNFLAAKPSAVARSEFLKIDPSPEEVKTLDQEIYIYFPNGAGRSKFPWAKLDKILKTPCTARNWNTVLKLLAMAEELENMK